MNCDILIRGCTVLNEAFEFEQARSVAISGAKIAAIMAAGEDGAWQAQTVIDAGGKLLMPGLIDGHTHVSQQLLRGRTTDEYPMIWTRILVPFESNLSPDDIEASTRLACLEMIKAGITSFADAGGVHMHKAADAVLESGMRAAIARSTMDIGANIPAIMKESASDHMRHTEELYNAYNGKGDDRVKIWFGMRQVMTCSPELIRMTAQRAKELNTGIHAHLCEHRDEVSFCLQNYKMRPAEFLDDVGALGPNMIAAHCVALSEKDITLLAKRDVKVVHCPMANLSSHGFPKVPSILEAGLSVGVGNDGASGVALDLFGQLRILKYAVAAYWGLPIFDPVSLPTKNLLHMATAGGAAAIGQADKLGKIAEGALADVILVDITAPHFAPTQNLAHTLVASATGRDVTHTIINGKLVMKDREVLTLDESAVIAKATEHMAAVVKRANI